MTTKGARLLFTLRQQRQAVFLVGLWALTSLLCGVMGPFGTLEQLPVLPRFGYWALICAVSIGGSAVLMSAPKMRTPLRLVQMLGFVLFLGVFVHLLNTLIFESWRGLPLLFRLWVNVGIVTLAIEGVVSLVQYVMRTHDAELPTDHSAFIRRIPPNVRGALVRIEAEDHYIRVITDVGETMILMRFSDALSELSMIGGLQVHRSHAIFPDQVRDSKRAKDRDMLIMSDGSEVPVSRKYRPAVRELGLV